MRLILASASPRRAELLRAAGFAFEIVVADVDERPCRASAGDVRAAAGGGEVGGRAHGTSGSSRTATSATDLRTSSSSAPTPTVVVDGEILGKPRDDEDAGAMLRRLSGRATRC